MTKRLWQIILALGLVAVIFTLAPKRSAAQVGGIGGGTGGGGTTTGTLTIYLPAKELLTPDQLRIGNAGNVGTQTFTFNPATGQFAPTTAGPYTVNTTTHYDSSNLDNTRSQGYIITVQGFVKGGGQLALHNQKGGSLLATLEKKLQSSLTAQAFAPPFPCFAVCAKIVFPYRLTFKSGGGATTLPKTAVASYQQFVTTFPRHNDLNDTYICTNTGAVDIGGGFLCLKENVKFDTTERGTTGPIYTLQAIPLGVTGAINIQGNVAAAGTIDGFDFNAVSNAIAIGGTVGNIANASQKIQNYLNQSATKFNWANVQPELNTLFAKRTGGTVPGGANFQSGTTFSGGTWNLNSSTNDPANPAVSSFSTPPEGKLWYLQSNSFLRIPGNITFTGSGTIAVNGSVELDGNITCAPGTRLGIIATGSINFVSPAIGCGAYAAIGTNSDITFGYQVPSNGLSAKGIFVAGHSVRLPSLLPTVSYAINYDDTFGANPTVLYQELLKVVFSTTN
ncbi:MAG TPA: hypothetical protein VLE93_01125 [Candidatus Saccharimonadales bacterium]|nr:hypothetical protein [Candidatus Saccharimonadales bacterium]